MMKMEMRVCGKEAGECEPGGHQTGRPLIHPGLPVLGTSPA